MTRLDIRAFGLMLGAIWGGGVFALGMICRISSRGSDTVKLFSKVYVGYRATFLGSVVGGLWGFADGFISGIVIVWIYNKCIM